MGHAVEISRQALKLAAEMRAGVEAEAVITDPSFGAVLAYEVDGFGSSYKMDDANIPSPLSLPYLGYLDTANPLYRATRKLILSHRNPYYFKGAAAGGIGGPHQGYGMVWPMAVIMQAMTSDSDAEISWCLDMLVHMSDQTCFMHESVNMFNVSRYTRP